MTDYGIITNIKDPEILQKIGWKFKTNILIMTMEPMEDIKTLPRLKEVQIKESYHDSIKIIDDAFNENKPKVAVIAPDLIGTYLTAYIAGLNKIPLIYICDNDILEPIISNLKTIGHAKKKILNYIKENPNKKTTDIFEGIRSKGFEKGTHGKYPSSAYVHINTLKKMQLIEKSDDVYTITSLGSDVLEILGK